MPASAWRKFPSGLSANFLQSTARRICLLMANKFHTCSLRCIFVHVHAAAKNDLDFVFLLPQKILRNFFYGLILFSN